MYANDLKRPVVDLAESLYAYAAVRRRKSYEQHNKKGSARQDDRGMAYMARERPACHRDAVSYTHLTLPTIA